MTDDEPDAQAAQVVHRRALDRIEADLLALLRTHASVVGWPQVWDALMETAGSVGGSLIEHAPASRPLLVTRAEAMLLYVTTAGARPVQH